MTAGSVTASLPVRRRVVFTKSDGRTRSGLAGISGRIRAAQSDMLSSPQSCSLLCEDIKEVEAKNKDLEGCVKDLETQVEGERSKELEFARRRLLLKAEDGRLKNLLSQVGGSASGSNDVVRDEEIEQEMTAAIVTSSQWDTELLKMVQRR